MIYRDSAAFHRYLRLFARTAPPAGWPRIAPGTGLAWGHPPESDLRCALATFRTSPSTRCGGVPPRPATSDTILAPHGAGWSLTPRELAHAAIRADGASLHPARFRASRRRSLLDTVATVSPGGAGPARRASCPGPGPSSACGPRADSLLARDPDGQQTPTAAYSAAIGAAVRRRTADAMQLAMEAIGSADDS